MAAKFALSAAGSAHSKYVGTATVAMRKQFGHPHDQLVVLIQERMESARRVRASSFLVLSYTALGLLYRTNRTRNSANRRNCSIREEAGYAVQVGALSRDVVVGAHTVDAHSTVVWWSRTKVSALAFVLRAYNGVPARWNPSWRAGRMRRHGAIFT